MYDWIVIVMAMFEVYVNYVENLIGQMHHRLAIGDEDIFIRSLKGEVRHLAVICFATAVQGPSHLNRLLGRGSALTVLIQFCT